MNNNNPDAINDKYDDNVEMSAKAEEEGLIESACKTKKSKSITKRNPFEKTIDDSINLLNLMEMSNNNCDDNFSKMVKCIEKELNKREEICKLYEFLMKAKQYRETITSSTINIENNTYSSTFSGFRSELLELKDNINKKKKRPIPDEIIDEETLASTGKKKKEIEENIKIPVEKIAPLQFINVDNNQDVEKIDVIVLDNKEGNQEETKKPNKEKAKKKKFKGEKKEKKASSRKGSESKSKGNQSDKENQEGKDKEKILKTKPIKKEKEKEKPSKSDNNLNITKYFIKKFTSSPQNYENKFINTVETNQPLIETEAKNQVINPIVPGIDQQLPSADLTIINLEEKEVRKTEKISHKKPLIMPNSAAVKPIFTRDSNKIKEIKPCCPMYDFSDPIVEEYFNYKKDISTSFSEFFSLFCSFQRKISVKLKSKKNLKPKRKLVHIHDSFISLKAIPMHKSSIINPRNPFLKDEDLVNYDKDSEEELMEENAEDIKSKDNSEEEDISDGEDSQGGDKFIVPDGYISQDEKHDSDIEVEKEGYVSTNVNSNNNIFDIMGIKEDFTKPYIFTLGQNTSKEFNSSSKLSKIHSMVTAVLLRNKENTQLATSFPIKIKSKKELEEFKEFSAVFNENVNEIIRLVHGSYVKKDKLINEISNKWELISKKEVYRFFKNNMTKTPCHEIKKKRWFVNKEFLDKINFDNNLASDIAKSYFDPEFEIKLKEREIQKQKKLELLQEKRKIEKEEKEALKAAQEKERAAEGGDELEKIENKDEKKEKIKQKKKKKVQNGESEAEKVKEGEGLTIINNKSKTKKKPKRDGIKIADSTTENISNINEANQTEPQKLILRKEKSSKKVSSKSKTKLSSKKVIAQVTPQKHQTNLFSMFNLSSNKKEKINNKLNPEILQNMDSLSVEKIKDV